MWDNVSLHHKYLSLSLEEFSLKTLLDISIIQLLIFIMKCQHL